MNNYKLIILDFDGTLCATHEAILFCIKKAYVTLGKTVPDHDFTDATIQEGLGMENTLKALSPKLSDAELQKLLDAYETIYLKEGEQKSAPFSKADEVLKKLYDAGYILTVVSNKAITAVNTALKHFALDEYISIVVGDTKALRKKPDPMAYNDFIKVKFPSISPREILMVGDTPADILFAQNIGADSCWAEYGYGDAKICRALNPTYTIRHLTDILAILP
ncbi:HAD family hydrolase [Rickettsiella endosymbiont of Dermanyssus gallinae]|uniref:HAD family hydrolase n=1 Tax=Rickettsiella endosymbiont of Dermanyssus gallinae TaxID=2856608 RepID=UPI001C52DB1C|nr:HAD family hydrolase [Rickettsiella endosymbiont of Dermanyssus gallinae]